MSESERQSESGVKHPALIAVLEREGSRWIEWRKELFLFPANRFHAMLFEDGSVCDVTNGWRNRYYSADEIQQVKELWKKI